MSYFPGLTWAALGLVALAGCFNTSVNGHTCGPNGACLAGFTCNGANVCVPMGSPLAECSPTCGPLEQCVRQVCLPSCNGRACPAGAFCNNGQCVVQPAASELSGMQQLGATCTDDSDCTGTSTSGAPLFCLMPYGGFSAGFCTANCTSGTNCGALAPVCQAYTSESGPMGVSICAPASCEDADAGVCDGGTSLLPCTTNSDCVPSGLVCGVYATGGSASGSLTACRQPVPDGGAPGAACNPKSRPCVNGLCVQVTAASGDMTCTATCGMGSDCMGLFTDTTGSLTCTGITVGGGISGEGFPTDQFPVVRAQMCMSQASMIGESCEANSGSCSPDAPLCIKPANSEELPRCAPPCTGDLSNPALQCPTGFTCETVDGGYDGGVACVQ